ncbi:hypothetical protein IMG5_109720 [Ichthyophthirius multifiliis]|uniref:Uncharacterized protein n=1 Tax=Ichthyophthirius multifiliis TaxID=5932 RepID=G0QTL9_ICHMU|nr:hypothetical protein IMG5_109720 [Ichthyophthirius multifiliis]EGR31433.1 hypothetical protein IMG5_109720 [Ichthyophthirius multifiliis]|eukprot:XP_004034919.1 hypothetical protein IMG5_109720 [Ichthyophthirius multifiliis]
MYQKWQYKEINLFLLYSFNNMGLIYQRKIIQIAHYYIGHAMQILKILLIFQCHKQMTKNTQIVKIMMVIRHYTYQQQVEILEQQKNFQLEVQISTFKIIIK